MILLYYANYAVAAHGQWCILMAIVAQRGAIAIDQSCSGYANSGSTWRTQNAMSGARGGRRRMMETRKQMMKTKWYCDVSEIIVLSFYQPVNTNVGSNESTMRNVCDPPLY